MIGALVYVRICNNEQHPLRRAFYKAARGFENCDARAFGTDEGTSEMKTIFG
jgi:hypothetical protein